MIALPVKYLVDPQPIVVTENDHQYDHRVGTPDKTIGDRRSALAALTMKVIDSWSFVEFRMGGVFANLLGANPEVAMDSYASIPSGNNQIRMVTVAAASALSENDYKTFAKLMLVHTELYFYRNQFAHGLTGFSETDPDSFIVVDT